MSVTIHISGETAGDVLAKLHMLANGMAAPVQYPARQAESLPDPVAEALAREVQTRKSRKAAPTQMVEEAAPAESTPGPQDADIATSSGSDVQNEDLKDVQARARENENSKIEAVKIMKENYADKDLRAKFRALLSEFGANNFSEINDGVALLKRVEEVYNDHKRA